MSKDRKYLSRIADHFYNQTNFREGSATELVVSEIEGIYQQGGATVSTVELSSIVEAAFPQLKDRIKSIEGRVRKVASWAKSEGLVGLHKGTIEILPLFECPSDARKRERVIEEAHPREEGYLPTKVDLERAIDSLHTLTSDNEIDFDDLLVALEEDLFARGKTLKKNWRLETERNLDRWYS